MNLFKSINKDNRGLSLVELIVTIAIMAVVSVGIGAIIVSSTKSYNIGNSEVELQQEVQNITNILNNLVIDAEEAKNQTINETSGELANSDEKSLYIKTSSQEEYVITQNGSDLIYYKRSLAPAESPYPYKVERYTLSKNVDTFNAEIGTVTDGEDTLWDYTVTFTLLFSKKVGGVKATNRDMKTSFVATSRNGGAVKTAEKTDSVIVVVDNTAVIEPCQTIEIPFDILISGTASQFDYNISITDANDNAAFEGSKPGILEHNKKLVVKASHDLNVEYFNVKIQPTKGGSNFGAASVVKVYVRRVVAFDMTMTLASTADGKGGTSKDAVYDFENTIEANNPDRFFETSLDDDYEDPYYIRYTVTASGTAFSPISNFVKLTVNGSAVSEYVTATNTVLEFDIHKDDLVQLTLLNDMPKRSSLSIASKPVHAVIDLSAPLETDGAADNKTDRNYWNQSVSKVIVSSIFPSTSGYQRGADTSPAHDYIPDKSTILNEFINNSYLPYLKDKYKDDPDTMADLNDANYVLNNIVSPISNAMEFSAFYSIGAENKPDIPVSNTYLTEEINPIKVGLEPEDGPQGTWLFSQYKIMSGPNGGLYKFEKASDGDFTGSSTGGALRLDPNQNYMLEFVAVLFTRSDITIMEGKENMAKNSIMWPYYPKLLECGFRDDSLGENKFSFASCAKYATAGSNSATEEDCLKVYSDYAKMYDVGLGNITFLKNDSLNFAGGPTAGTSGDPIIIGNSGEKYLWYNQMRWTGLDYKVYQNRIDGYVDKYNYSTNTWDTLASTLDGEVQLADAGLKVTHSNEHYTIGIIGDDKYDYNARYRIRCTIRMYRYYAKDSDGIFNDIIYSDATKHTYLYPDTMGTIYFAKYNRPFELRLDANGGMVNGSSSVLISYTHGRGMTLPDAELEGYRFVGWFTAATGGEQVTDPSYSQTLYAHYEEDDGLIRLVYNDGTGTEETVDRVTGTLPNINRENYGFLGWFSAPNGGIKCDNLAEYLGTILYAQFYPTRVTFDPAGGTVVGDATINTSEGIIYYFNTSARRDGYVFLGWYTESGEKYTTGTRLINSNCLYARWEEADYSVTVGEPKPCWNVAVNRECTVTIRNNGSVGLDSFYFTYPDGYTWNQTQGLNNANVSVSGNKVSVSASGTNVIVDAGSSLTFKIIIDVK